MLGGIGDQHAAIRLQGIELPSNAANLSQAGRFHPAEHPVERQGLLHDMRMVQQLGIRRHKIGNGVHLDAVPDMVDHRPMRVGGLVAEFFEGAAHGNEGEIVALDLPPLKPMRRCA